MEEKCVNCKISGVPLYPGLDGHLHCADCIGMLINQNQEQQEENHNVSENHKS
jgi:uncharacterized Zn finger protein (UPF0148 family)